MTGSILSELTTTEILLIAAVFLSITAIVMLVALLRRPKAPDFSPLLARFETLEKLQERTERGIKDEIAGNRQESAEQARGLREEVQLSLNLFKESQEKRLAESAAQLQQQFESFGRRLTDFGQTGQENAKQARAELKQQFDSFAAQLTRLTESNEKKAGALRIAVDSKLKELQADNTTKLEEMRKTVDEKLQSTLDKRLGESFKQVSDRLEQVHTGLGEMKTLANGVGDLKRVLTNVKTRGTWGEVQLGNLLEQILTPEQYAKNVCTKPTGREAVEFALKLPGPDDQDGKPVWLPIDAKFPKEDYERIVDASERGDVVAVEQAAKDLENRVRSQARDIRDKYIAPPHTTDFGLLYLPTEGLYAEVFMSSWTCRFHPAGSAGYRVWSDNNRSSTE